MIIMMKYRVIKAVNGYGETIYVPQYRRFLMWRNMDTSIRYYNINLAINYIRSMGVRKHEDVVFEI